MRRKLPFAMSLVGIAFVISGCATIVEGTSQSVLVKTDPGEAKCEISKNGSVLAVANPTPASVLLPKSKDDLQVNCQKTGYRNADAKLASTFQAMTLGNILLGGVVGAVVDSGSGAANKYDPEVLVLLSPEKFSSEQERDEFYVRRVAFIQEDSKKKIEKINSECPSNSADRCKAEAEAVTSATEARLQLMNLEKASATITPASL